APGPEDPVSLRDTRNHKPTETFVSSREVLAGGKRPTKGRRRGHEGPGPDPSLLWARARDRDRDRDRPGSPQSPPPSGKVHRGGRTGDPDQGGLPPSAGARALRGSARRRLRPGVPSLLLH